jgi:hypothetical protein
MPGCCQWCCGDLLASPVTHGAALLFVPSTIFYYDNVSVVYLASNPIQHQCTMHIEIDLNFICDKVAIGEVHILYIPTTSQFTDIFIKGLSSSLFSEFCSNLNICRG